MVKSYTNKMNSPKDYLTDRVKEFRKQFVGKDGQVLLFTDEKDRYLSNGKLIEAFLTETIQQSMEVGREEGKQMAYLEMLGSETPLDYTGKARNAKELNENMIEFTKSLIKQHENAIKKLKSLSQKL